jgi:hypothetical protein
MAQTELPAALLGAALAVAGGLAPAPPRAQPHAPAAPAKHVRTVGERFVRPDGRTFQWRGITAFRLLERLAARRQRDVESYLDWAAAEKLTVVRVLAMASELFALSPERGLASLDRLLELADARGLYVEVVALADTARWRVALDRQVAAVAAVCARHANTFLELANEPVHPTQNPLLARPATLVELRAEVPPGVPVAVGSVSDLGALAAGDYVTIHPARGGASEPWAAVWSIADAYALVDRLDKPVVNDEPIGAADKRIPGRRDNDPARFRAIALLSRFLGAGVTFHYEGGLEARIPSGAEADCLAGWQDAWTVLPDDFEARARLSVRPGADSPLSGVATGRVFEAVVGSTRWVLAVGSTSPADAAWREGWNVTLVGQWPGVWLARAGRAIGAPGAAAGRSGIMNAAARGRHF